MSSCVWSVGYPLPSPFVQVKRFEEYSPLNFVCVLYNRFVALLITSLDSLNNSSYNRRLFEDSRSHLDDIREETGYDGQFDADPCYELRKLLSDGTFYYSSDFDLTRRLQKR